MRRASVNLVEFFRAPCRKNYALDRKINSPFFNGLDELYHYAKFDEDRTTRAGCRCENVVFLTMLPAGCHGNLTVLNLLSASGIKNQNFSPCGKNYALDRKMIGIFRIVTTFSISMQSLGGEIELRAPAVGAKIGVFCLSRLVCLRVGDIVQTTRNNSITSKAMQYRQDVGTRVTLPRRTLITMSIITMRSRLFPANSASDCLRFIKFRPQFCQSCGAIYRWIYETFGALQSTSGPVTVVENSFQIDA